MLPSSYGALDHVSAKEMKTQFNIKFNRVGACFPKEGKLIDLYTNKPVGAGFYMSVSPTCWDGELEYELFAPPRGWTCEHPHKYRVIEVKLDGSFKAYRLDKWYLGEKMEVNN